MGSNREKLSFLRGIKIISHFDGSNDIFADGIITKCMAEEFWCKNMCKLGGVWDVCTVGKDIIGAPKMRNNYSSIQMFIFPILR